MSSPIRVHVAIAHAGLASRRKAEELIRAGKVQVNNQQATIGQLVDPTVDHIVVDHTPLNTAQPQLQYILLNKKKGSVSTTQDEHHRQTVLNELPASLQHTHLYPVGRLDQDSRGLMLLTNDGELAFRTTQARFGFTKTYWVRLDRLPTPAALTHLQRGVKLKEGWAKPLSIREVAAEELETIPAADSNYPWFEMVLSEGRKHQVKRMWERVGYPVQELVRVGFGPLRLESMGNTHWRKLTNPEVEAIKKAVDLH